MVTSDCNTFTKLSWRRTLVSALFCVLSFAASAEPTALAEVLILARTGRGAEAVAQLRSSRGTGANGEETKVASDLALLLANDRDQAPARAMAHLALAKLRARWTQADEAGKIQVARLTLDLADKVLKDRSLAEEWTAELIGIDPDNKYALAKLARFERLRQLDARRVEENRRAAAEAASQAQSTPALLVKEPNAPQMGHPASPAPTATTKGGKR